MDDCFVIILFMNFFSWNSLSNYNSELETLEVSEDNHCNYEIVNSLNLLAFLTRVNCIIEIIKRRCIVIILNALFL